MRLSACVVVCFVSGGCEDPDRGSTTVQVSAAASLGPTLESLRSQIEHELGLEVQLNLAGSGTLTRQVMEGAPTDLIILAHPQWMDPLIEAHRVLPKNLAALAGNRLVVVGRGDPIELDQLGDPRFGRIALGDPASVPAGHYAEQALRQAGVWEKIQPRLITTADVRAGVRYAQTGDVDAALVYRSDLSDISDEDVRVLCIVDPASHDPIVVTAGVVDASPAGIRLMEWLRSEPIQQRFTEAGFDSVRR
ncbi:MAG: molybdate ABC transporter substrate-binding protein [Planctomycetota bacterium]